MTPRLYRAAEVCERTGLQQYVLRSWEKEFPGIGVQKTPDGPRLYREADIEQVQRIKQLVFGEGLTVSGARRKLETSEAPPVAETGDDGPALDDAARAKIAAVKVALKEIQTMLTPRSAEFVLEPPAAAPAGKTSQANAGKKVPEPKRRRVSA